jgi:2-C-methyl-D-erythritol 4-phosphate cytidylyltransferase
MSQVAAILLAAGGGRRFGSAKQFALLGGKPVLAWSLEAFESHPRVDEIVLVVADEAEGEPYRAQFRKITGVVRGGEERQDSVAAGFGRIDAARTGCVLIHDAARPFVTQNLITAVIAGAERRGAAVPILPVEDTVKEVEKDEVLRTMDRAKLVRVQTPQGFSSFLFKRALEKARADGFTGTDDASLVERLGEKVFAVPGDRRNMKITTREDWRVAEVFLDDQDRNRV